MESTLAQDKAQQLVEDLLENSEWDVTNKCVSIYRDTFTTREDLVAFLYDEASGVICEHGLYIDGDLCEEFDSTWIEEHLEATFADELSAMSWNL